MSRLVYKGDTINNFGRHLPVPYIERIEILNLDGGEITNSVLLAAGVTEGTKITLYITLLFNTDDDFDIDSFKKEVFSELDLNVILLAKAETIEELRNSKKTLKDIMATVESVTPTALGFWQYQLLNLNEFIDTITFTGDYDEDMNSVIRTTNIIVELETARLELATNLTVFAGTSVGKFTEFAASSDIAYALNFSSLAYEHILINSELATRDQIAFFTVGSEEFYSGVPLRAINKKYYKTEKFGPDDIKLLLNGVMNNYRNYVDTDEELRGALQNIEFIYARYGEETSFLTELQKYSSIFPNRDVTTPTGNLYERFKKTIINSNTLLLDQPEVVKRLVRTTKIRDLRLLQYTEDFVVSYNEAYSSADILYEGALHTNLAKYVVAPDSPEEGELYLPFEAEVPKTPQELTDEFREALSEVMAEVSHMTEDVETFADLKSRIESETSSAIMSSVTDLKTYLVGAHPNMWDAESGAGTGDPSTSAWKADAEAESLRTWIGHEDSRSPIPISQFGFDISNRSGEINDPRDLSYFTGGEEYGGGFFDEPYFLSMADYDNLFGWDNPMGGTTVIASYEDAGTMTYMDHTDGVWTEVTVDLASWQEELTPYWQVANEAAITIHLLTDLLQEEDHLNILQNIYSKYFDVSSPSSFFRAAFDSEYRYASMALWGWDLSTSAGRSSAATEILTSIESMYFSTLSPLGDWSNIVLRLRTGRVPPPKTALGTGPGHVPLWMLDSAYASPSACGGNPMWLNMLVTDYTSYFLGDATTMSGVCSGPGNWSYCLGTAAAAPALEAWESIYRGKAQLAIVRALELLYAYWGNTIGTGRHKKLAEVDIVVQKYGWYFFDMEKYIRHQSHLSRYMDVSKLINHFSFSRDMLNYTIRLAESRCETVSPALGQPGHTIMKLRQDVSPYWEGGTANMPSFDQMSFKAVGDYYHMKIPALDVGNWKDFVVDNSEEIGQAGAHTQSIDSTNIYAYLMLRNFDFPDNAPIDDNYRLMAFNYNYFMDDDQAILLAEQSAPEELSAMVTVDDQSLLVLFRFGEYIRNVYAEFLTYYDLAKENCAYNRYDSQFNTFFADSMNDEYAGRLGEAPWFRAPVVLALYRDLFANQFDGDMFYILENARKRSDNINPTTGYLEALEQFKEDFENLITHYEEIWGWAEGAMARGDAGRQTYVFGGYSLDLPDDDPELGTIHRGWSVPYFSSREIIDFVGNYEDALPEVPSWVEYSGALEDAPTGTAEVEITTTTSPTGTGTTGATPSGTTTASPTGTGTTGGAATPSGTTTASPTGTGTPGY